MTNEKFYTKREEKANFLTHGFGLLMSVVGTALLLNRSIAVSDSRALIGYALFGFGMIICMSASTVYHYIQEPILKSKLRHFDHAGIYLLIAASYSPFTLILLRDEPYWEWSLFIVVWLIAIAGILISFRPLKRNSHLKTISYVLMGLIVLIAFKPLTEIASEQNAIDTVVWLIVGGLFYIAGAVIYATAKREFIHALFHVFVLLGLTSHIYAAYIIPL
ncbi:MAG: hemolysin III family protein [Dysgonamonadaceae bacterium]|jgi:hemolysin III|nr:hemolysin III family protein [Dysgonamonadaceae bacterium]MDD3308878.1 hemolysin III family protein [Dysgonamonadaceae bacterium]MDD3900404.1 hemolysin III family protein [Dysgonamonadaceae bacterium]MDD4398234.1 hemolysin III family protein [Dysgonamonadaceae bacterium]MEA5080714.1 hemolysin III family protein [Dysgonamonadaceae bacterium]